VGVELELERELELEMKLLAASVLEDSTEVEMIRDEEESLEASLVLTSAVEVSDVGATEEVGTSVVEASDVSVADVGGTSVVAASVL